MLELEPKFIKHMATQIAFTMNFVTNRTLIFTLSSEQGSTSRATGAVFAWETSFLKQCLVASLKIHIPVGVRQRNMYF